ncbi:MAG: 50S ribosomal protein L9 [Gaiellales bacterium]
MDVILLQDVEKLGHRGQVVAVSRGYLRNYLEPRQLATLATPHLAAQIRERVDRRERQETRTREHALEIAEALNKTVLRFEVKAGHQGVLFGSVTPSDIADELWRVRRVRVDRRKIHLGEPIKRVGQYQVPVEIFEDLQVEVKTIVAPENADLVDPADEEPTYTEPEGLDHGSEDYETPFETTDDDEEVDEYEEYEDYVDLDDRG